MKKNDVVNFDLSTLKLEELIETYKDIVDFIDFLDDSKIVLTKEEDNE